MQPRVLFQNLKLGLIALDAATSHHLAGVLRVAPGASVTLFDGQGREGQARVTQADRQQVCVEVTQINDIDRESPVQICVVQSLCTGDKMDWVVQKSTELGATRVVPLAAARSVLKLEPKRAEKRLEHWQAIAESAAAQSGRTVVPAISPVTRLNDFLAEWKAAGPNQTGLILDPFAPIKLSTIEFNGSITLLIGPEAGWTDDEEALARDAGFIGVQCGPRILRTETAAAAVLAAIAIRIGEF